MPDDLSIPRMPRKQIELWDITSTSGNFRPYQIQTANIHFFKKKAIEEKGAGQICDLSVELFLGSNLFKTKYFIYCMNRILFEV